MVTLKQRVDASISLWQMQNMGVRKFNQGNYHVHSGNRSAAEHADSGQMIFNDAMTLLATYIISPFLYLFTSQLFMSFTLCLFA